MTIEQWLAWVTSRLQAVGATTARLDALVLLEDCLQRDRALLLAHPELELTREHLSELNPQVARRALHEPLAYIRGRNEFYGREFAINKNVLEPRPESETMITLLKELSLDAPVSGAPLIVDVGTGSGALAITAKLELPSTVVMATDIDPRCLELAAANARQLGADVTFAEGDLLAPVVGRLAAPHGQTVLLCNLPYVPDDFPINQAAEHEPGLAIFGGADGLDLYHTLFAQIAELDGRSAKPQYILAESLPEQHMALSAVASKHGYKLTRTDDFIQLFTRGIDVS